jgi:hypothetical protein
MIIMTLTAMGVILITIDIALIILIIHTILTK